MSAGDLIESLITFTTRVAYIGMAPKDPGPSQHDPRQGAWQRELARAQSAARVQQGTDGRDALASLSVVFDPLLSRATDGAPGAASARGREADHAQLKRDADVTRQDRSDGRSHGRTATHSGGDGGHAPSAHARPPSEADAASVISTSVASDAAAESAVGDANVLAMAPPAPLRSGDATSMATPEVPPVLALPVDAPAARMAMHGWSTGSNVEAMPDTDARDASTTAASTDARDAAATSAARVRDAIAGALQEHAPIRLHVQWGAAGARVWIGLDADSTAHAAQVVDSVSQWLGRAGARLRSVVCNGVDMPFSREAGGASSSNAARVPIDLLIGRNSSWPPSAP